MGGIRAYKGDLMTNLEWRLGDVTVTRIVESIASVPPAAFIPLAAGDALAPHLDWLRPSFVNPDGNMVLSIHALLVESAGRKLVVDTCVGNRPLPEELAAVRGTAAFVEQFAAAGFPPDEVDTVICTHLHFDHVGWNTMLVDGKWVPTFPNARYILAEPEWTHWAAAKTPEERGAAITLDEAVRPLFDYGVVDLVAVDHEVTEEVRLVPTPGHTPGHVSVRISSLGEEALITGDMAHHPVQLAEVDWFTTADSDQVASGVTRRRVVDENVDTKTLVIGTHFAPPCAGYLVRDGGRVRLQPAVVP
jgi:glyoxylase-like metal-dependent hydrolase (beta-lactamase superfamily II)